jgi:hypothetical protein
MFGSGYKAAYVLDGSGSEIPAIKTYRNAAEILITGTAQAVGNYAIGYSGTPNIDTTVSVFYKGSLDITTNGVTFSILGQSFNQNDLNRELEITFRWSGASWIVITKKDFKESGIIEASHMSTNSVATAALQDAAVTTIKIADLNVTTPKIADDAVDKTKINADVAGLGLSQAVGGELDVNVDNSTIEVTADTLQVKNDGITTLKILNGAVTTPKIADNAVTTAKILDGNVTTAKVADNNITNAKLASDSVTTVKIVDDAVTNDKLATMTVSSIKIGNSTGNPTDLAVGNRGIPIGNGTTITTVDKESLTVNNDLIVLSYNISFETDFNNNTIRFLSPVQVIPTSVPARYGVKAACYTVTDTLSGTDDATIELQINGLVITGGTITIPLSSAKGTYATTSILSGTDSLGSLDILDIFFNKPTAGGSVHLFVYLLRVQ